jgi:ATP-dependent Clp protease adaptor protein ClpS
MTEKTLDQEVDEILLVPILGGDNENEGESGVVTVSRSKIKRPRQYKVLLHNDDYTTMEFVVYVLQRFFGKTSEQAQRIMLKVHTEGIGVCGVFTHEIAETKVTQVSKAAKENGHPLMCTMEPAD